MVFLFIGILSSETQDIIGYFIFIEHYGQKRFKQKLWIPIHKRNRK